jgi:hypothetical protein
MTARGWTRWLPPAVLVPVTVAFVEALERLSRERELQELDERVA